MRLVTTPMTRSTGYGCLGIDGRLAILFGLFVTTVFLFYQANQQASTSLFLFGSHSYQEAEHVFDQYFVYPQLLKNSGNGQFDHTQQRGNHHHNTTDSSSPTTTTTTATSTLYDPTKPLNILILYPDDWRHDTIGIAKTQPVLTPFLDDWATYQDQSIRFTHNCVTTSICWISRATLFTGQYLSRHLSSDLNKPTFCQLHRWNETWPYLLRHSQYRYWTGHIGKWQFHNVDFIMKQYDVARIYEGYHWMDDRRYGRIHVADKTRNDTIGFLRRRPLHRPFALTVAFYPPKAIGWGPEQWFPKNETKRLYQNITIPEPVHWNASWYQLPDFFRRGKNEGRMRWKQRFGTSDLYQNSMKSYYALITQVDEACRDIVHELKRQGVYNQTLLIFTTDNGFFHGEHGLAGKWYPYQESIRVPLIIRDPRMSPSRSSSTGGLVDDSFTLNIDLAPTILAAANLPIPSGMQGRDLSQLYRTPTTTNSNNVSSLTTTNSSLSWRQEFFYEHPSYGRLSLPASSALVRKNYKYMYFREHRVERLFDLIHDPLENEDIKNRPEHARLLKEMRQRHNELLQQVR